MNDRRSGYFKDRLLWLGGSWNGLGLVTGLIRHLTRVGLGRETWVRVRVAAADGHCGWARDCICGDFVDAEMMDCFGSDLWHGMGWLGSNRHCVR